jgi:lipopolysaccharide export LptBFGC system permease protein LptF
MQSLFTEILIQAPLISFAPKTTINIGGYSLYANSASKDGKNLSGISIYKFIDEKKTISKSSSSTNASSNIKDNEVSWRITASSASIKLYKTGIALTLHNGYWQKNVTHNLNNMIHMTFNSYSFFISLADKNKSTTKSTSAQELNSIQLLKTIKTNKKLKRSYTAYSIEFFSRLLFATAPLIFAFIAIPIGLTGNKNSKAMGFLISLIILLGYYMLLIMSINIAEKGLLPAGIIMWAPNLVLLLCGSYLFSKMVKK